jgi:hypothetical protein
LAKETELPIKISPASLNEIKNLSNNASKLALSKKPLNTSKRSASVTQSAHGLAWLTRNAGTSARPVFDEGAFKRCHVSGKNLRAF